MLLVIAMIVSSICARIAQSLFTTRGLVKGMCWIHKKSLLKDTALHSKYKLKLIL